VDFGEALAVLRAGGKAARAGWYGQWVALSPGFSLPGDRIFSGPVRESAGAGTATFSPYLMLRTPSGAFVPWAPAHADLLAADWTPIAASAAPLGDL